MKYFVKVHCFTYNHNEFIKDALDGFCMQKTNFPYVCLIFDDCSTDGESTSIKNYIKEHFDLKANQTTYPLETDDYNLVFARHKTNLNCYFAVFLLKYNHYSRKKLKLTYSKLNNEFETKYIAICEGDDYWTDPNKLQKQADFMESNPDYSLCFHNASYYNQQLGELTGSFDIFPHNTEVLTDDIIKGGGGFCPTCSLFYRAELMKGFPDYFRKYSVGDYPLQLYLASVGKVFYFKEIMGVYRIQVPGSWSRLVGSDNNKARQYKRLLQSLNFIDKFDEFTEYKYHKAVEIKKNNTICNILLPNGIYRKKITIKPRNKKEKINYWLIKTRLFPIKHWLSLQIHKIVN